VSDFLIVMTPSGDGHERRRPLGLILPGPSLAGKEDFSVDAGLSGEYKYQKVLEMVGLLQGLFNVDEQPKCRISPGSGALPLHRVSG
jgi:hypothetical protein